MSCCNHLPLVTTFSEKASLKNINFERFKTDSSYLQTTPWGSVRDERPFFGKVYNVEQTQKGKIGYKGVCLKTFLNKSSQCRKGDPPSVQNVFCACEKSK